MNVLFSCCLSSLNLSKTLFKAIEIDFYNSTILRLSKHINESTSFPIRGSQVNVNVEKVENTRGKKLDTRMNVEYSNKRPRYLIKCEVVVKKILDPKD